MSAGAVCVACGDSSCANDSADEMTFCHRCHRPKLILRRHPKFRTPVELVEVDARVFDDYIRIHGAVAWWGAVTDAVQKAPRQRFFRHGEDGYCYVTASAATRRIREQARRRRTG